jgi:type IV secretory pathway VirB2 component (pilin)
MRPGECAQYTGDTNGTRVRVQTGVPPRNQSGSRDPNSEHHRSTAGELGAHNAASRHLAIRYKAAYEAVLTYSNHDAAFLSRDLLSRVSTTRIRRSSMRGARLAIRRATCGGLIFLISHATVLAQSPWERAANNLALTFTGPLARSLALVAIVIGGLMFMFGEAGAKRQISGIVFGGGLALFAAQFLAWLF